MATAIESIMSAGTNIQAGRSAPAVKRPARKVSYFPPQHGGWAFLGLPIALGLTVAPWSWLLVTASIAAVAAFPLAHFTTAFIRYPNRDKYKPPLAIWATVFVPFALLTLATNPWLLLVGIAYAVIFAVNVALATHGQERSMLNDTVFIIECVALIPVLWAIGVDQVVGSPPSFFALPPAVWLAMAMAFMAMVGSTLHVKSLIRERANPRYRWYSLVWAVASIGVAAILGWTLGVNIAAVSLPFVFLAGRSIALGDTPRKPGVLGMVELVGFILVLLGFALCGA